MARNQPAGEPVGTPPEGGRWTWNGQWVRLDSDAPVDTATETPPAANELQLVNEET